MHRLIFRSILFFSLCFIPALLQANIIQDTLLPQKTNEVSSSDNTNPENDAKRIRRLLQEAHSEFSKIDTPESLSFGAPPGTPTYDLMRRRFLLRLITTNYERLLSELNRIEILRSKRNNLDKTILAGLGSSDKPPYSILLVERLRELVQGAQFKVKLAEISLESSSTKKNTTEDRLKKLDEKKRALLEKIENEADPSKLATLEWDKLLVDLNRKYFASELAVLQATQKNTEEELAIARKELSTLGDRLDEISKHSSFTESDLNLIKKGLEARRSAVEKELEQSLAENESLQNMAEKRVNSLSKQKRTGKDLIFDKPNSPATRKEQLKNLILQENLENSNIRVELQRDMLELNRVELLVWELRYAAEVTKDKESTSRINRMIPNALTTFAKQEEANSLNLNMLIQKQNQLESELVQPDAANNQEDLKRLLSIYKSREELLLSRIKATTAIKSVFTRLSSQYSEKTRTAITNARLANWKSSVWEIWSYELFATEDVYTVDGKEIKGKRGVTIGKVVSAMALLVIGWIVSSKSTKIFVRHAIKRYDIPEGGAMLARRWIMALIFVVLLFTSLNLVRIPLTAFAFLGGAIALGTGFGIQVLMKNLMSGLMLLTERPFRIGDLIDVDGVRGRVTSIGIRSSTIRDVTGIETLVPNSTFVEKNVTNWTHSTQQVRYNVTVGVAYGSDIQLVKERLLSAAASISDVLKDPEPIVTLDEFGADSIVFGIYFWIRLDSNVDPKVTSSDLRILIEKYLTEENVAIAYPQRDIHIDNIKPLQVEIVDAAQPTKAAP